MSLDPTWLTGDVSALAHAAYDHRSLPSGELDSALSFVLLNSNQVTSPATFFTAMSKLTGSFNWLYTSAQNIAYFHSALYPIRAKGVDPDLPSWGTGRWEWKGFLPAKDHPQAVDPAKGWIDSWNNKPAHGWRAADSKWAYGPGDGWNNKHFDAKNLVEYASRELFKKQPMAWQAFWKVQMEGRATDEVGAELGMTPAAVRKAKLRVLHRLRQERNAGGETLELQRVARHLESGAALRTLAMSDAEEHALVHFGFLSRKPMLVVVNVAEAEAAT